MIISHTHQFIFIKSIKTAGTSIETALSLHCSGNDIVTPLYDFDFNRNEKGEFLHNTLNAGNFQQHDGALTIRNQVPEVWRYYFKFSIARNPWDRAVSNFHWERRQDSSLQHRKRFYHYLGVPYDEMAEIRKKFTEFIKNGKWESNDSFYSIDGKLCVDFIIHYETLLEDFNKVCEKVGVPANGLPHLKSGFRQKRHHYSEYFDEESKAIVADRHKNDIRLFGYEFEEVGSSN